MAIACDEVVYRISREIVLLKSHEFSNVVLCIGSFHMIKVVMGCIGKYLDGSGAEQIGTENRIFGVNVVHSVLGGKHYNRTMKGFFSPQ